MRIPFFSRQQPVEAKDSAVGGMTVWGGLPEAQWSDRTYQAFSREAYQRNIIAFQAIDHVARAAAQVRWTFWRGDTEIIGSPFEALIDRPNPVMTGEQYVQTLVGYWLLSGNRYQERVTVGSQPRELYALRPDRMQVLPGDNGLPRAYRFDMNGRKHDWEFPGTVDLCDVLHERTFHPTNDWYGMSPVEAAAYAIDLHNGSMDLAKSLQQNSARPSGAMVMNKESGQLSDESYNRLKAQLESQYQGTSNAGRPMLLEGGLDWKAMGFTPKDMEALEARYASARDVCLAFGVPPLLLSIPGDSTYSNFKEARLAFWEETVIPLCTQLAQGWTDWIGPSFGGIEVRPDFDGIPAIAEKMERMWDMADKATDLTLNERRQLKGFEPVDGGDVVLVPGGMQTLEAATAPRDTQPSLSAADMKALAYGVKGAWTE